MTAQRPRRWKGCPLCGIHKDSGQSLRTPFRYLRQIGKGRRVSRHELPEFDVDENTYVDEDPDGHVDLAWEN